MVGIGNAGGGMMLLGVNDKGEVTGTRAFQNPQDLEHRVHLKVGVKILTREIIYQSKRVLSVQIPGRHAGTPLSADGKYLIRTGESLVAMTPHELREIINEGDSAPGVSPVTEPLPAEEVFKLLHVDSFFKLISSPTPSSPQDQLLALSSNRLLLPEEGGRFRVTTTGALFLANNLNDFPTLAWRRVRFLKYAGYNRIDSVVDSFETSGYGLAFERLMSLIRSHVPNREKITDGRRMEHPLYHPTAVREFLANALVHQDLSVDGIQITVEVFSDRIEIKNPGLPLIEVTRFVDGARTRNRELSDIMRLARLCEARGSGVDRALTHIEDEMLPAPEFHAGDLTTTVVLYGERPFDAMTTQERAWAVFLHSCVKYVESQALTNSSLRERFGLDDNKSTLVSNTINSVLEQGLIKVDPRAGKSRRHARYLPFFA